VLLFREKHRVNSYLRTILSMALVFAFTLCSMPAFAQTTTGTIAGTVTGDKNAPVAGVAVEIVSPSQRYATVTDSKGFFSVTGVVADTYAVTLRATGYQPYTAGGVTLGIGQSIRVDQHLVRTLQTIGRATARSTSSAFQPTQTTDAYTVSSQQMNTILGKANAVSESNLLAALPGASFDSSGYPVLRGGRENEEGFQFEGIPYTDPFTNQFINSLELNGAAQFQLTPGGGDASTGNSGTGTINIVAKRGARPAFANAEADVYGGQNHRFGHLEFGAANPSGNFSNYASFNHDVVSAYKYGPAGTPAPLLGRLFSRNNQWSNDFVENAVYKFGKDKAQSLQFFYENTQLDIHNGNGYTDQPVGFGLNGRPLYYKDNDPFYLYIAPIFTGLSPTQIKAVEPFTTGQTSLTQQIGKRYPENYNQPNESFKFQYSNNLDASTFLTAKFWAVNAVSLFDFPYITNAFDGADFSSLQGGLSRGVTFDVTKQLDSKNLLGFGGLYTFLHPTFSQASATGGLFNVAGFGYGYEVADFLPNDANCPLGAGACGYLLGNNPTGTQYVPNGTTVPMTGESASTNRSDWALYLKDTYSPTDRLKIDAGLRMDASQWHLPTCTIDLCVPTSTQLVSGNPVDSFNYDQSTRTPRVLEPSLSIANEFTRNDSMRVSYRRSVQFPLIAQVDLTNNLAPQLYGQYYNVPSYNVLTGSAATFCGTTHDRLCANYGDQLFWENEANWTGPPIQPLKPTTYNNYEFSYSHQFPGAVALKMTPFYRKAYNAIAQAATPLVQNGKTVVDATGAPVLGPPINTNLGNSQITGVEFLMTKEATYGLSGQVSLTYQNEFSNVIPTSPSEDFFPSVPYSSLLLGNTYRVGFLSPLVGNLSLNYKTRTGFRINPSIYYNHGYPIGSGLMTPITLNGQAYNVPNTNITNNGQLGGSTGAPQYVDPQNPGSVFSPNVAATRGTPETSSPGGVLSKAIFAPINLTLEYTPPSHPRSTVGVLIANVFNNYYSNQPVINPRYQPVATGHGAPYSGYSSLAANPAFQLANYYNYVDRNGNLPYIFGPSSIGRTVQVYFQQSF
jgi:hypothetical protein